MMDTIAAISTAVGPGAMSIVRLSGPEAIEIANKVFSGRNLPSECSHKSVLVGEIVGADGIPIDQVVLLIMRRPRSYTGEDLVEITCHGGITAPRLVLGRLIEEGARLADPGEYTKRAFLNGRIDLAQAEAVADLVQAKSEKALRVAMRQVRGDLSTRISEAEGALFDYLAVMEANIDFPEDEVEDVNREQSVKAMEGIGRGLRALISSHATGRLIKNGIDVVIVGKPNVGKSSLFNSLLGTERVIVSDVPGTTRDIVDGVVPVDGLLVNLHDTAGVLEPRDRIEAAAVERTRAALEDSDIVLVVFDASTRLEPADTEIQERTAGRRRVMIFNKIDIEDMDEHIGEDPEVRVSALEGRGIDGLLTRLRGISDDMVGDLADEIVTNERHASCLGEALEAVERARAGLAGHLPLELVASDLRSALLSLESITGSSAGEKLLDEIFSRFCIGK